ncbi:MAG: RNA-binding domain-containing protein [Nitrosopumilus sp.]
MNTPNLNCKIEMFCIINPSESIEKVEQTISNIFPYSIINNDNFSINAISKELRSFEKIYQFIHNNKLQKNFLRSLEDNLKNDTTWFYLNKQAAFVEQIALCEEFDESPLGPIKVTLTSSNIDRIIDWIVFD